MTKARLEIEVDSRNVAQGKRSLDDLSTSADRAEKATGGLDTSTKKFSDTARLAAGAVTALGASMVVRQVIQYSEAWTGASNQLRLVTSSSRELATVQQALLGVSNDTRSSFESTANLYARLSRATSEMGLSQQELLGITTTINQSFAVSGATASEAAAAITQLSQGLAAGALRGDEFNSVAEQAPGIMRAIADSLGLTVGELRAFAAEGGITAQIVVDALQGAADSIENDFSKANITLGQSFEIAKNNMMAFVGESESVGAVMGAAGRAVIMLSENLDDLGLAAGAAAIVIATRFVPAIAGLTGPIGVTTAAVTGLYLAFKNLQDITDSAKENSIKNNIAAGVDVIQFAMYNVLQEINKVNDELAELGAGRSANARRKELQEQIASLTAELERYAMARAEAVAEDVKAEPVNDAALKYYADLADSSSDLRKKLEAQWKEREKATEKAAEYVAELRREHEALGMTGRAAAVFNAVTKAGIDLTAEQIAEVATLTAQNYDLEASTRATAEAEKQRQKDVERVNAEIARSKAESDRAIRESQQATHDYLSESLVDIMNNGGNAFDNIAKSFERMVQRMIAEWAASGLMSLFGIGGGGTAASVTGGILSGITGGLFGGGAKAAAGTVAGEIAAGGVGGLAGTVGGGGAKAAAGTVAGEIAAGGVGGLAGTVGGGGGSIGGSATSSLLSTGAKTAIGSIFGAGASASALPAAGATAAEWASFYGGGSAAAGGGILSGVTGAASSAWSGITGALGSIPGWGWALAGGAALAAALGDKSTPSANAGMLIRDVPAASDRTFDVPAFDSGFKPVGFARREDQGRATEVINVFRADDAVLTALAKASGIDVSYSANQFGGFNEKGQGNGLFFGQASEDGRATSVSLDQQRDQFVKQWIYGLSGKVDPKLVQDVLAQGNADAMIRKAAQIAGIDGSYATGLDYVPFDNHRANLHTGERVLTNKDARAMDGIPALLSELIKLTASMMNDSRESKVYNRRAYEILDRWQGTGFPVTT